MYFNKCIKAGKGDNRNMLYINLTILVITLTVNSLNSLFSDIVRVVKRNQDLTIFCL